MRKLSANCVFLLTVSLFTTAALAEDPYPIVWSRQLGTIDDDGSISVAVDGAGNIFISGLTNGSLGGINAGDDDSFLAKYDPAGNLLWTEQLGTSSHDEPRSVAVDTFGNAFISGYTHGSLGGANAGYRDAFLAKYDPYGNLIWTEQLGTNNEDISWSMAVDGIGNAFISGHTTGSLGGDRVGLQDAFLSKYDTNGNQIWIKQLGTSSSDYSRSVAVDGFGNVYISGTTGGNLGGTEFGADDAYLAKYDTNGILLWIEQLGSSTWDESWSVTVDGIGNAFISGFTEGNIGGTNMGGEDTFLAKYNPDGNLLWTEQLGTSNDDYSYSVAMDGFGNAFISGYTRGSLGGPFAGGYNDAYLAKYDPAGNLLWTEQIGTSFNDYSNSIVVDGSGNAFISGGTQGSLGGTNAGGYDAILVKFAVPEPASLSLLALGSLALLRKRHRQ